MVMFKCRGMGGGDGAFYALYKYYTQGCNLVLSGNPSTPSSLENTEKVLTHI